MCAKKSRPITCVWWILLSASGIDPSLAPLFFGGGGVGGLIFDHIHIAEEIMLGKNSSGTSVN